ncbi:uncharacterized protein LOC111050004 isoform X2 [Nilaparvata lugens]|uniref:uncharacterized protein LOC111050004 isoform X1 n=1 Tax=Nilaparvata lugens TaxID=108931 RepID=UPI00193CF70F|nr:uncharacterized protein LOC111050004 isoform X1 [Nilaparvata lugens]XP_039300147.1 uncharacterized protein LOC111050004 isoform X2 [Nilaparvata lugens]
MATTRGLQHLSILLLLLVSANGLALGGTDRGGSHRGAVSRGAGDQSPLDLGGELVGTNSQEQLIMDEREAEVREALLREYEAMQQQERNAAYLALLLDKLRSLPLVAQTAAVAPPSPPQQEQLMMPVAAPLQQHQYYRNQPEEKKSNYISYCHFKICNMGKRKWN